MVGPYSSPYYLFTPLIASLISFILAGLVVYKGPRITVNRLLGLTLLCVAMWALFIYFMRSSPDTDHALFWEHGVLLVTLCIFVFYYHFTSVYTRIHNIKLLWIAYSYLLLIIILGSAGLLVAGVTRESNGYAPNFTILFPPLFIFGLSIMALGIRNLYRAYRIATVYEDKVRYTYLIAAALLPLLLTIPDFFPSLPPTGIFGNLVSAIIMAVAIIRYNLLDINLVIRKSMLYLLVSAAIAIPYVGFVYTAYHVFGADIPIWGHIIIAITLAILLQAVWQRMQETADRLFYRERYDYLKAIEEIGWQISSVTESESFSDSIVNIISNALKVSTVSLLMPLHQTEDYGIVASSSLQGLPDNFRLSKDSPLIRWMESDRGIVRKRDFDIMTRLQLISDRERTNIDSIEGELFIPLLVREQLVGIIILGKKLSEQPYSIDDKRLLLSIASQVSIQLENSFLYVREKEMNQRLLEQGELKDEFLLAVAHELRTPLTAILSSSEVMSSAIVSSPGSTERRLADNINRSAMAIDRRIKELLDSARAQLGVLDVNPKNIDLTPVIKGVVNILLVLFNEKKQSVTIDLPSSLPKVIADRDRIEQVMINLLSNANKFSPRDSAITVRAFEADSMVVLEVEDSAEPITEKEGARLFEPYYRGEDSDKRKRIPGLGLGLVICRRLVELQNGKIWFKNRDSNRGNIFAFSIPIAKDTSKTRVI